MRRVQLGSWIGTGALVLLSVVACGTPVAAAARPASHVLRASVMRSAVTTRIGGNSSVTTAAALAEPVSHIDTFLYGSPDTTVIIAPSGTQWTEEYAVLAANPLAYADQAPILLSATPTSLGSAALHAIRQLHATHAVVVGVDNNPTLIRALQAQRLTVQGLGSSNPDVTGAAIGQALLAATGQHAFSNVFVVAPNTITQEVSLTSPADSFESPILVTTPPANAQATLPADEAGLAAHATTVYAVGTMATGSVTNVPATANVVDLGSNSVAADVSSAINFHFFTPVWTMDLVNLAAADIPADLAAGPYAAANQAPLIPFTGTVIPGGVVSFLQTVAPSTYVPVAIGGSTMVPPIVLKEAKQVGGGTVFATLEQLNMDFVNHGSVLYHKGIPETPAWGPYSGAVSTVGEMNNPAIIAKYGGPKIPISLKAIGQEPNIPSNDAIVGLTPAVEARVINEGSSIPAVGGPLTQAEILSGVRAAARSLADSAVGLGTMLTVNPEAPSVEAIRPHENLSVAQTIVAAVKGGLPHRVWIYRTWVNVSHAQVSTFVPSGQPANHVIAGMNVSGLTLNIVMANVATNGQFYIALFTMPDQFGDLDLIANGTLTRWYGGGEGSSWRTGTSYTIYFHEP